MDLTRREMVKNLSVLPFLGFDSLSRLASRTSRDKTYDYSNFKNMFQKIDLAHNQWTAVFNIENMTNECLFTKPYLKFGATGDTMHTDVYTERDMYDYIWESLTNNTKYIDELYTQ